MTLFIFIKGIETKPIDWNSPVLPRIGEHIHFKHFIPDIDPVEIIEDLMIVRYIEWFKLNEEVAVCLFLEHDESEEERIFYSRLN